ncbi:twin-arginine translocase subunit TatB [Psychrobacter sp. NZS113]|uniref:Sec-independent protein translocase protein TatB n=1 Tax=Psychrobacter sp. NZS113 TaxID=2792045 RepID=UPI0018CD34F5|nr:Sec-independent protein translocase protein TatB [Psychrobacter sp. NZS113]MBH0096967.1 twin-arginine translocase subunit TatB [Psychrobacter sp. NZS113]
MFDIGFSELLLFGIIALIVLGPEKLPQAARTAGQWYAKIRRTVSTLQSEIEAELDLAETRQQMQKELAKIRQTESDMKRELAEMRGNMKEFENAQNQHFNAAHDTVDKRAYGKADENNGEQNSSEQKNQSVTPKEFDYAYVQDTTLIDTKQPLVSEVDDSLHGSFTGSTPQDSTHQVVQNITTKPWENMWFRLGAYDKARRLPMPPYLPNYKADVLLNSPVSMQTSDNKQESD